MSYVTTSSRHMLPPRRMPHRPRARERAAGTSAYQGRPAEGAVRTPRLATEPAVAEVLVSVWW